MIRIAANLTYLWAELPYLDRFDAAADAGFKAVEVQQPYDVPAPETQAALQRNDLQMVLLNAPGPNYAGGERGFAAVPGLERRFDYDMRRAVRYAQALGAKLIHVESGRASGPEALETLISNLKRALDLLPDDITLTIEPLGPTDAPGYFLNSFDAAAKVIEDIGSPQLGLQFDTYHAQDITSDVMGTYHAMHHLIRHIQIGDAPGRVAPNSGGEVDFKTFFEALKKGAYKGWVSAEYNTDGRTEKTLGWLSKL